MPPAISDNEIDSAGVPDMTPAKLNSTTAAPSLEEEDDEKVDDDEYNVEKILSHSFGDGGAVLYQIKWLGYEDEADLTWEPVENLERSKELLDAYHAEIGGTPRPQSSKKKKSGRTSTSGTIRRAPEVTGETPAKKTWHKGKTNATANGAMDDMEVPAKRELPIGSWEHHVLRVASVLEETSLATDVQAGKEQKELVGLLEWKNAGPKTQHTLKVLRQKAPQKLLDYLLSHLIFTQSPDELDVDELDAETK